MLLSSAMAGAQCATPSFLPSFATATPLRTKKMTLLSLSSISTPSSPRLTRRRKNHLRQKLIKTLPKPNNPLFPEPPPTNPIIPIDSPIEQHPEVEVEVECPSDQFSGETLQLEYPAGDTLPVVSGEELEESENVEFRVSEAADSTAGVVEGSIGVGKFPVLKFGLWLVGAFVFQTICAVWISGSVKSGPKYGYSDDGDNNKVLELGTVGNDNARLNLLLNAINKQYMGKLGNESGGNVYINEAELEERIEKIRAMARQAREKERLVSKRNDFDEDDDVRSAIENQVDNRLVKLKKRLQGVRDGLSVNYLSKDVVDGKGGLKAKEANEALMFKKKYRFRGPSAEPRNKPKGFMGSVEPSAGKIANSNFRGDYVEKNGSISNGSVDLAGRDQQEALPDEDLQGDVSMSLEDNGGRELPKSMRASRRRMEKPQERTNFGQETGATKIKPEIGSGEIVNGKHSVEYRELSEHGSQNSKSFRQETEDTANTLTSRFSSLKSTETGRRQPVNEAEDETRDIIIDPWWSSLPYVLAISMHRGRDGEGPEGLFSLKTFSHPEGDLSHPVAFEDRVDATNFCYLLQSFFEDLGDFHADIVPFSVEELKEAVRCHTMKVLVVKKGQLKLYAGQALADVEIALRSLVDAST